MVTPAELLAAYDSQLRGRVPEQLPEGEVAERDGPVVRFYGGAGGQGWVLYRDLGDLEGAALDVLIARQVAFFADRGERFEWKQHGHDLPEDLSERLLAHGFVPEDTETIVVARVDEIAGEPVLPDGVDSARGHRARRLRTNCPHGAERVGRRAQLVGRHAGVRAGRRPGVDHHRHSGGRRRRRLRRLDPLRSRHGVRDPLGRRDLAGYRRKGIYRATVAYRANLAQQRGKRYLETDASDDSNPILQRLGFVPVTTTTPYIWSPPVTPTS